MSGVRRRGKAMSRRLSLSPLSLLSGLHRGYLGLPRRLLLP